MIGHFDVCDDPVAEAGRHIVADWRAQAACDQERWAYVISRGRISESDAQALADEVWRTEQEDDEDEEEQR